MRNSAEHDMRKGFGLIFQGLKQGLKPMSKEINPPGGDGVDVGFTRVIKEQGSFGLSNEQHILLVIGVTKGVP